MQEQSVVQIHEGNDGRNQEPQESGRRKTRMFWFIVLLLLFGGGFLIYKMPPHMLLSRDPLLPHVKADSNISASDFDGFIRHLDENRKMNLLKALSINSVGNQEADCLNIKKEVIWRASHWMSYPFKKNEVEYHEIVKWTARKMGVTARLLETYNTFQLERCIVEKIFERSWDKMTPEQREEFLKTIDHKGNISGKAGIAALSGAGALAALSTTAYISGITFFSTTMSAIATLGHAVGVTLPFMIYTKAATATALLTGPIGWGIAAVIGAGRVGSVRTSQCGQDRTGHHPDSCHKIGCHVQIRS